MKLEFAQNIVSNKVAKELSEFLKKNPSLSNIELRFSSSLNADEALEALFQGLKF